MQDGAKAGAAAKGFFLLLAVRLRGEGVKGRPLGKKNFFNLKKSSDGH